jgi:hypothetical protein
MGSTTIVAVTLHPRRILPPFSLLLALLSTGDLASDEAAPTTVELRGRWILDTGGKPIPPETFRRGLQPSGLVWRDGVLASIGDQRSQYPGHLFRIDPASGRLLGSPARFSVTETQAKSSPHFARYRELPNADFEGIAILPMSNGTLLAVTEDKTPWIAALRPSMFLRTSPSRAPPAPIQSLTRLRFPDGLEPWRGKTNFRIEGIAISDEESSEAKTVYLAYERATDNLPRILTTSLTAALSGKEAQLETLAIDFASLPKRPDKGPALLNVNDIQFLRRRGKPYLIAIARDQERLLLIDLKARKIKRWIDLDLRDPKGRRMHWVSPEGLAFDEKDDHLWVVNDPDSVRGNYKLRGEEKASGHFASYVPLLFEMKLSALFPSKGSSRVR